MPETRDPGTPQTDESARYAALHAIAHVIGREDDEVDDYRIADLILAEHVSATWERDVNSAGVPVRRYVLRGPWEVDPEAAGT